MEAASINRCFAPPSHRTLDNLKPEPEPPPKHPQINVTTVEPNEYNHDERHDIGVPFISNEDEFLAPHPANYDHLLWDTYMFPTTELEERSLSPTSIIRTLAMHDATRFTTPITKQFLQSHFFKVQVDGGANRSVTNCRDCLHTSWDITPYKIGGIGDGITCTAKGIFHFICTDGSVLPITMFYSKEATETVVSPTDTVFSNADAFDN